MSCYYCGKPDCGRHIDYVPGCRDCGGVEYGQTFADPAHAISFPEVTMDSIRAAIEEVERVKAEFPETLIQRLTRELREMTTIPVMPLGPIKFDKPEDDFDVGRAMRWLPMLGMRPAAMYPRVILPEIPKVEPPIVHPVREAVDPVAYRMCPKGGGDEGFDWAPEYQACEICCVRDPAEWTVAVSLITVRGVAEEVPVCVECSLAAWALSLPGDQMKTRLFYPECLTESPSEARGE